MYNDIYDEMSQNFIEYAVSVNTDRAIPDAKSGLKPVATRILYGAYDSGKLSSKPHTKCAKLVGEVMGQLHPHGDSSIYGALVRLAQPWVMRYPLIDIHGNMGNIGGDGPAAMRYTEMRLAKLSEDGMLAGIKKRNVDFKPNYDDTTEEPVTLPALFPNLLCNPNAGIGVAMSCNWVSFNLTEVAQAINEYLDGKEITTIYPDFATGGVIINKNDIPAILDTGHGSIKVRGKYKIEKQNIVFYEIPYGTATEELMKEVGELADKKEIEGIDNIRDESNKNGLRIVIECEKGIDPEAIVKKLFTLSDLQTSISCNQVALVNKTPTELNFLDCIKIYVEHNIECIKREKQFDLNKAQERKEIVDGLLKALEDIDNIIKLIKESESAVAAKAQLQTRYEFSEPQARAIVDMKLGKLAGLEKIELQKECADLTKEIKDINALLNSEEQQEQLLRARLAELVKKYGDARRTEVIQIDPEPKEEKVVEPKDCIVIMSQSGNIKRIPTSSFKVQKRNGKGNKTGDDATLGLISTNTIDTLMLFTNLGKMYRLLVDNIPEGTSTSKGINIANLIKLEPSEKVIAITSLYHKTNAEYVIFITKKGLLKKTKISEYTSLKKNTGIAAIKLKEGDSIANVTFVKDEDFLLITKQGMSIRFESKDINAIGRVTSGVRVIKLSEGDEVLIGLPIHKETDELAVFLQSGFAKKVPLAEFPVQNRDGKGLMLAKNSEIAGAAFVSDNDNILIIGETNSICISCIDIPSVSRTSVGSAMIKNNKIKSVVKL